jgi:hypothetical protein
MAQNEARGYPQMIERIDCMLWKNFPFAWQVLNKGHHGEWCVVVLEGVEYYDMWIWHALFLAWSHLNDMNMLQRARQCLHTCWRPCSGLQLWDQCQPKYQRVLRSWWHLCNMIDICEDNLRASRS